MAYLAVTEVFQKNGHYFVAEWRDDLTKSAANVANKTDGCMTDLKTGKQRLKVYYIGVEYLINSEVLHKFHSLFYKVL